MTTVNVTQVGAEVWAADSSTVQVTQLAAEIWGDNPSGVLVTQVGAEVWAVSLTTGSMVATQVGAEVWAAANELFFSSAAIWRSDIRPQNDSSYVEGGQQLSWTYATVLSPDNPAMAENLVVESTLAMAFIGAQPTVTVSFNDTNGQPIQTLALAPGGVNTIWGAFIWGQAPWGGTNQGIAPYQIAWTQPLVFKQGLFAATGLSASGFRISNLSMRLQTLGYMQQLSSGVR